MNQTVLNLLIIFFMLVITAIYMLYLYVTHRIFIDTAIEQHGVLKSRGGRYKLHRNGKLYAMFDFFGRKPIEIPDVKDYLIIAEGMPFWGINRMLNIRKTMKKRPEAELKKIRDTLSEMKKYNPKKALKEMRKISEFQTIITPWKIPNEFKRDAELDDYTYSWSLETRIEAYEDTKHMTTEEMMARIVIPLGLIALAALLIIMFPKLLEAIRTPVLNIVSEKLSNWQDILVGVK